MARALASSRARINKRRAAGGGEQFEFWGSNAQGGGGGGLAEEDDTSPVGGVPQFILRAKPGTNL